MFSFVETAASLLLLAKYVQPLHTISPDFCSIPYLVPLIFQRVCDASDVYYRYDIKISEGSESGNIINFEIPPDNVTSASFRRSPNMWNFEPWCLESQEAMNCLCVYTNSTFADSRGISFIATPSVIQDVLKAAAFTGKLRSPDTINVSHKYIRKSVPGNKRFEMLAKVLMKRGESLHSYQPVLAVQDPLLSRMTKEDQTLLLRIAIERLPKASQELFLSQFAEDDKDPYIDRMDKNAFNSQFGRSREFFSAALPETAKFNHDCRPNTAYHLNPETMYHNQYVIHPIKPGEEITLSYLPPYANSTQRAFQLNANWGFNCTCKLCTSSEFFKRQSDSRLNRIQTIISELNVPPAHRKPDPSKAEKLVKLHEQEGLWGPIAGAHMYVAMEYHLQGDEKKAKEWAAIAKESLKIWSGAGHEYHSAMKRILGEELDPDAVFYKRLF